MISLVELKFLSVNILLIIFLPLIFDPIADYRTNRVKYWHPQNNQNILEMATRANLSSVNPYHFVKTLGGIQMPKLIYGTAWKKERTADLVVQAVRSGFRGIDTACQPKHYFEPGVGEALKRLISEDGMKREDLFIQTKFTSLDGQDPNNIPYDKKAPLSTQVQQSLDASLKNLGTTYIDSLVMHSPSVVNIVTIKLYLARLG